MNASRVIDRNCPGRARIAVKYYGAIWLHVFPVHYLTYQSPGFYIPTSSSVISDENETVLEY